MFEAATSSSREDAGHGLRCVQPSEEIFDQCRFSDSGFAGNEDYLSDAL
jgi:hypothetical protein